MKINFPKGIKSLHVPYIPEDIIAINGENVYEKMYKELKKYEYPKSTRSIKISHTVFIDLKGKPDCSYEMSEVVFNK